MNTVDGDRSNRDDERIFIPMKEWYSINEYRRWRSFVTMKE